MHFRRDSGKTFRHFKDPLVVHALLDEMRARHGRPYKTIGDEMVRQIKGFYEREFKKSKSPPRFATADMDIVRERLIVPLSAGIDSSLVLYLAAMAVSTRHVLPVTMPAWEGDPSADMARIVRDHLEFDEEGKLPYVIPIHKIVEAYQWTIVNEGEQLELGFLRGGQSREQLMRCGNFASRVRIAVLYDLQSAIRGRILGTSNRTEFCQGYSTKFGTPISYDFGVMDDLYKIDVYELAAEIGLPEKIIEADPSTGYFEGQTHEGELGATLEEQDVVSYLLFEKQTRPEEAVEQYGLSAKFVQTMQRRWDVSQHKRLINKHQEKVLVARRILPS